MERQAVIITVVQTVVLMLTQGVHRIRAQNVQSANNTRTCANVVHAHNAGMAHILDVVTCVPPVTQRAYDVHATVHCARRFIAFCAHTAQYVERIRHQQHVQDAALNVVEKSLLVFAPAEIAKRAMLIHAIVEPYY